MCTTFLIAAVAGFVVGWFLRAGALVAMSLAFVIYAFVVTAKGNLIQVLWPCFVRLVTIQASYILGLAMSGFAKRSIRFLVRWYARMR